MVKIQEKKMGESKQYVITIPMRIIEYKGWKKGTELIFEDHTRDSVILKEKK